MEHDVEQARKILEQTETSLRELIEHALSEQQYSAVAAIAGIADAVGRLLRDSDRASTLSTAANNGARSKDHVPPSQPAPPTGRILRRTYPRFEREGDKVVKIAWSKRDRAEYEHKASRRIVDLLIEAIKARKGAGAKFDAPDVLPLKDSKSRREIPSYQSYLALAWLRHEGVIIKYGRDGYALKTTAAAPEHLAELWEALPSRD
jgi:hypothetical protein